MANLATSWDKDKHWNNFEFRSDPFQVLAITKKTSVWVKELDIQIGDILFIETVNVKKDRSVTSYKVINMSAQLQRSGSRSAIRPFIPNGPINGVYRNDYIELKPLTWKTVTDEQINHREDTKDKEPMLNL